MFTDQFDWDKNKRSKTHIFVGPIRVIQMKSNWVNSYIQSKNDCLKLSVNGVAQ